MLNCCRDTFCAPPYQKTFPTKLNEEALKKRGEGIRTPPVPRVIGRLNGIAVASHHNKKPANQQGREGREGSKEGSTSAAFCGTATVVSHLPPNNIVLSLPLSPTHKPDQHVSGATRAIGVSGHSHKQIAAVLAPPFGNTPARQLVKNPYNSSHNIVWQRKKTQE